MTWLIAQHPIHHNQAQTFAMSDAVDMETGEHKMTAVVQVISPGEWFDGFPADEAAGLVATGAAREPTPKELQLRQMGEAR